VLGIIPVQRGLHPTKEGHVDLVEAFGKYTHTLYPGLNLLMPWEKVTRRLNVQETTWTCDEQRVSLSREQFVRLKATISYHLWPDDAHLAMRMTQDWEGSLRALFVGTLQSVVNVLAPADFVSWSQSLYMPASSTANAFDPAAATRWDYINSVLSGRIQDQVAAWGVEVNWVRILEPTILPHTLRTLDGHKGLLDGSPTLVGDPNSTVVQVPVAEKRPEVAPVAPSVATPAAPPAPKIPKGKALKVEVLIDAYNAVRQNVITDPATIRDIAQRFEQLSSDPEASKMLDFDATRAASTLRQRAQKFQERAQS
ncbi:MAG: SPFH domain-containing protein, partial [Ktedonobacteraceae bacterium]